uniref:Acylglycerol kinase, mitochondrial n=1 Tax=Poecilia latipinna TaxID=48699 RepID=A0A3B3U929_9TELE
MARIVKVFRTLRNHWKKSTLAVCVLSYGGYWLYVSFLHNNIFKFSTKTNYINLELSLKKATVILNPAASNGKANNLFEKNAAPILHLAGVEITVVKTDYEGQAKKLMELMEQTDMLIVAGGDGTLQEVITGLLRRPDQEAFSSTPIGFIPLGSHNSLSPSLHFLSDNKVKDITAATLSILKGETVPVDVLQIKGEKEQPVFALIGLRWGAFRDVAAKISKYWYLGPLKTNAAHWFHTLREWPLVHDVSVSLLAPRPRPPDLDPQRPPRPNLLHRIIRRLKNYWSPPAAEPLKPEEPEKWEEQQLNTAELYIQTHNKNPAENKKVKDPTLFTENSTKLEASVCRLTLPEGAAGFYNIDNEEYEAMPVEVRLLPRKLRFFISAERREELISQPQ